MTSGLRERLIEIQRGHEWADREMAEKLGITREAWRQVRTGICKELGRQLIRGALRAFPELSPEILAEFRDGR